MQHSPPGPSSARDDSVAPVFLRMPTVMRLTGLVRSTIYRLIADQKFPSQCSRAPARSPGVARTSIAGAKRDPTSPTDGTRPASRRRVALRRSVSTMPLQDCNRRQLRKSGDAHRVTQEA